jgi:hypothetical protein
MQKMEEFREDRCLHAEHFAGFHMFRECETFRFELRQTEETAVDTDRKAGRMPEYHGGSGFGEGAIAKRAQHCCSVRPSLAGDEHIQIMAVPEGGVRIDRFGGQESAKEDSMSFARGQSLKSVAPKRSGGVRPQGFAYTRGFQPLANVVVQRHAQFVKVTAQKRQ